MDLCLVRHAIAEARGPEWPDDSERPLTPRGRERMRAAARGLAVLFEPDVILTSPYTRARETAEILREVCGCEMRLCQALATGDDTALLHDVRAAGASRVAAVGHEPYISRTASWLLAGNAGPVDLLFKKGAAALLSFEGDPAPGRAVLEWLLEPKTLRKLAEN